ncbi:MAG: GNAT family N-acetyltransferase [Rhodoglobus sp.]
MDSSLTVRQFADSDAKAVTRVLHAAYAELGNRGLNYTAVDQDSGTTLARARGGRCWVVERGEHIVGTLTMSMPPSSGLQELTTEAQVPQRAWLNQVAVLPTEQRAGIASELWRRGQKWARNNGATSIGVDTAVPAEHLVKLYQDWGFEMIATIHWPSKTYDSAVMLYSIPTEG